MSNVKKVLFRGPALTSSGYGVHARQVVRWLLSKNIDLKIQTLPWGETPWLVNHDLENGLVGEIIKRSSAHETQPDVSFQLQLPNEWDPKIAKFNVGMTAGVETDICNPKWIDACNQMNLVIVPSTFFKQTLESSGKLTVPIVVGPESFSDEVKSDVQSSFDFSTPFNFLMVSQMTGNNPENDRKNILYTLKWICEQFRNDSQVGVVLKTNASRNTKIDRNVVLNTVGQAVSQIRPGPNPKIHIVHGQLSDVEVVALYRHPKIKALVSATRGEGYGLPLVEAAASGLPVIATNWSGHLDFLNVGRFLSVDYSLVPVHQSRIDGQIFVPGAKWAQPDEADFKKVIRNFKHNPTVGKQWAVDLQKKVLQKFSFNAVSMMYDELTKEIL